MELTQDKKFYIDADGKQQYLPDNPNQRGATLNELKLAEIEKKLDELTDWLIDNPTDSPDWNEKVSRFHEESNELRIATATRPSFTGINEIVVPKGVPTSQNYK